VDRSAAQGAPASPVPPLASVPPVAHRESQPDTYAPDGSEIRLLIGASQGATRASVVEVVLPAGGVSRPVWHRTVEEVWYILEGRGHVWRCPPTAPDNASTSEPSTPKPTPAESALPTSEAVTGDHKPSSFESASVGPGDALVVPTGWYFQFRATPEAPLRFLCYTSPPWPGSDEAQPAPYGALGEPTV
jgi:mannose-6-phosphate isomerase-like protein (cupin superfamily)